MLHRQLTLFLAAHQILDEVDGQGVVRREVCLTVDCEEVVNLAFALVLGCKFCGGDLLLGSWLLYNLLLHVLVHSCGSFVVKFKIIE